jgi:hypothetical protein
VEKTGEKTQEQLGKRLEKLCKKVPNPTVSDWKTIAFPLEVLEIRLFFDFP